MLSPSSLILLLSNLLGCRVDAEDTPQTVSDAFKVRGSVEQIHVWAAEPDTEIELVDASGELVASGTTDSQGSLILRELEPGVDFTVRLADDPSELTDMLEILDFEDSVPPQSFYEEQILEPGNGYITMRDGTQLAYYIYLPGPIDEGPYPTLVNYSGYTPSEPGASLGEAVEPYCDLYPILCDAPSFPTGIIGGLMGYAVVGVNMRGTGCSGGAYDYFEPLQITDGYDIIEAVAAQQWVKHNHVGMAGLSFPGISQLFVAQAQPPSLAAITPFSVIGDTMSSTLIPGGIFNEGFAEEWYDAVLSKAAPYGHDYIQEVVDAGDSVCEENQLLHSQMLNRIDLAKEHPFYDDELARPIDPSAFADQIQVPIYLAGQWQDEQTGPHFPALFTKLENAPIKRFTVTNGVHIDGFSPQNLVEWKTFLDLYVSQEIPEIPKAFDIFAPLFMEAVYGTELGMPDGRFDDYATYDEALAAYEAEGELRVIFDSGAPQGVAPGAPEGTWEMRFESWPPPQAVAERWYLQPDGTLLSSPAAESGGSSSWEHDAQAGERISLASGSVDPLQPNWDWQAPQEGMALSFLTPPLEEDLVVVGHGSVDLYLMTEQTDADIEVSITEVTPDGDEILVQHGWLRASHRALREDATETRPVKTHRQEDIAPLTPGEWTLVRVEVMPFSHAFRAGSQLRLSIDTPGDNMARWRFDLLDLPEGTLNHVAHDAAYPSSLVLSVIPDIVIPTELPDCADLRGQPCREYAPIQNLE